MGMEEGCAIRTTAQMSRLTSCPITPDSGPRVSRTMGTRRHALPVCQFASLPDKNRYNGGNGASQILRPRLPGHILRTTLGQDIWSFTCLFFLIVLLRNQLLQIYWSSPSQAVPWRCLGGATAVAGANPACMLTQLRITRCLSAARSGSPAGAGALCHFLTGHEDTAALRIGLGRT